MCIKYYLYNKNLNPKIWEKEKIMNTSYVMMKMHDIKTVMDKMMEVNMLFIDGKTAIFNREDNSQILRAYTGALKEANKGNLGLCPRLPGNREFFNILFVIIMRSYFNGCKNDLIINDFIKSIELFNGYKVDMGLGLILYRGEEDMLPWVVSRRNHPSNTSTILDDTIGEMVFNQGMNINTLAENYHVEDPYQLAYAIADDMDK